MKLDGKRIIVTGGAGFLGKQVVSELGKQNPAVIFSPRSSGFDLRSPASADDLMEDIRPHIVFHLAASVGGIGANQANPGRFLYDDAMMGLSVIEAARKGGVEKLVLAGTVCSYPKDSPVPFKESDLWNGEPEKTNAPYGIAKKMLMVQVQAYRQQYGLNAVTLILVNLYGPGDNFDLDSGHVIPALIRKVIEAQESNQDWIDVWGSGNASREFIFVRDAARAFVMAAESYDSPDPVNVGTGKEITIRDLTELICSICNYRGEIRFDRSKPDGQMRRCLDVSRATAEFGFEATTVLKDGLKETVRWYRQHRQRKAA